MIVVVRVNVPHPCLRQHLNKSCFIIIDLCWYIMLYVMWHVLMGGKVDWSEQSIY